MKHPLSQQCTATSKRSGERCRRPVIASPVCIMHGGKAPQTAARRAARLVAFEAQQRAVPLERDPATALLAACHDADSILAQLKAQAAGEERLTAATLTAMGDWLDRVTRIAKVVLDARVDARLVQIEEARANLVVGAVLAGLDAIGVEPDRQQVAVRVLLAELRRVAGEPGRPALTVVAGEFDG